MSMLNRVYIWHIDFWSVRVACVKRRAKPANQRFKRNQPTTNEKGRLRKKNLRKSWFFPKIMEISKFAYSASKTAHTSLFPMQNSTQSHQNSTQFPHLLSKTARKPSEKLNRMWNPCGTHVELMRPHETPWDPMSTYGWSSETKSCLGPKNKC